MRSASPLALSYGDGMRVAAVVAVVGVHVAGIGVTRYGELAPVRWWTANVVDSLCRWGVPMFIMLSGALLLDPARADPAAAFYRKRLARVGIPLVFWAAFYFLWTWAFYGEPVDRHFIARSLVDGLTYNHLYFLFILLGLYAVAPVLRTYLAWLARPGKGILAALLLALVSQGIPQDVVPMNAATRFLPFVAYFVAGIFLRDTPRGAVSVTAAIVAFVAATAAIAIGTDRRVATWGPADWRALSLYDTLGSLVIVQSIAMFLLLRACFTERPGASRARPGVVSVVAPLVFGIYLVHRAIHDVLGRFMERIAPEAAPGTILLQMTAVVVVSGGVVALIRRIPYVRRVVG